MNIGLKELYQQQKEKNAEYHGHPYKNGPAIVIS
jgi:hypothetical protein